MTEHATDRQLRDRARAVIPGGMYGHQSARSLPPAYPQFMRGGVYLHPRHNWFVSAAMTGADLALVLEATDQAFAAVRKQIGQ
jgi:glutamate-1-semialdehyde aminotransferase